jgi:hypothetical protein
MHGHTDQTLPRDTQRLPKGLLGVRPKVSPGRIAAQQLVRCPRTVPCPRGRGDGGTMHVGFLEAGTTCHLDPGIRPVYTSEAHRLSSCWRSLPSCEIISDTAYTDFGRARAARRRALCRPCFPFRLSCLSITPVGFFFFFSCVF